MRASGAVDNPCLHASYTYYILSNMAKTKEKDVNIRIRQSTNKRLKIKAIHYGCTVKDLLEAYSRGEWFRA